MSGYEELYGLARNFLVGRPGFGTATWLLAGIFAWSGVAKWRDPRRAAKAMSDFGLIKKPNVRLGNALGVFEVLVSISLAAGAESGLRLFASISLAGTAVLLSFFVYLMGRSLRRGKSFSCFCLGDTNSMISGRSFIRTAGLTALAIVLLIAAIGREFQPFSPRPALLHAQVAGAILATIALLRRLGVLVTGEVRASVPDRQVAG
jgi:uncharacterized membrane protein YphA (DoxX/SURF4 family)